MPRNRLRILLATLFFLTAGTPAFGQEEPLRDVISAQWEKYKEQLKDYQFRDTSSHHDLLTGKHKLNYTTIEYKLRGSWKLYVRESKDGGSGECSVVAINGHYAFTLEKDKEASPWRVGQLDLDLSNGIQLGGGVSDPPKDFSYRRSPYSFGPATGFLPELLKRPGFSVTKTESAGTPEEGFRKIWFKVAADEISGKQTGSQPIEGTGWFLLDPKCYWRIREFELPFLSPRFPKFRAIGKYEYDMARDNYPLLKQIDVTYYPPDVSEKPMARSVTDYVLEKRVPEEKEFRLSGFGFPEPMGVPPVASGPRWHIWLSLAAAGSLCLALLCVAIRRRYFRSQTPAA